MGRGGCASRALSQHGREGGLRHGSLSLQSIAAPYLHLLHQYAPRVGWELLTLNPAWEGPRPIPPHLALHACMHLRQRGPHPPQIALSLRAGGKGLVSPRPTRHCVSMRGACMHLRQRGAWVGGGTRSLSWAARRHQGGGSMGGGRAAGRQAAGWQGSRGGAAREGKEGSKACATGSLRGGGADWGMCECRACTQRAEAGRPREGSTLTAAPPPPSGDSFIASRTSRDYTPAVAHQVSRSSVAGEREGGRPADLSREARRCPL